MSDILAACGRALWRLPVSRLALIAVGSAWVVQLLFLALLPAPLLENASTDYRQFYEPVARNVLAGRGLTLDSGALGLTYPPGIPLLYAAVFAASQLVAAPEPVSLRILELLLTAAMVLLVFAIGTLVFGRAAGFAGALILATYPIHLWNQKQPETTYPFAVPILGAILVILWWERSGGSRSVLSGAVCGLLLGLSALFRPFSLLLGLALAAGVFGLFRALPAGQRLVFAVSLLAANLVTFAPWVLHVRTQTGLWLPLSNNGPASISDGLVFGGGRSQHGLFETGPAPLRRFLRETAAALPNLHGTSELVGHVIAEAGRNPAGVAQLAFFKAARSWYGTDSGMWERHILLLQIPYLVLMIFGMKRAAQDGDPQRTFLWLALLVLAYFWAVTMVALTILRYMLPVIALLMVFPGRLLADGLSSPVTKGSHESLLLSR
ncbi:MAG: glycosyltransferase family 39 protein [Bryobacterales bacterium]|nr:glycosyltransferase family 39 protein [Bryobacterales bacterium]